MPEKISWMSERRKVSELIPASYNPRKISDKQSDALNKSLERFDLADPIIINTDNKIIGGHQRINALKARGVVEVDVRVPSRELTEAEEKELNLRLNAIEISPGYVAVAIQRWVDATGGTPEKIE